MTCRTCTNDEGKINPIAGVLLPCPGCRRQEFEKVIENRSGGISPLHRAMLRMEYPVLDGGVP